MKKLRYKLSPELGDGDHWTVVDTKEQVLDAVAEWCSWNNPEKGMKGDGFEVELVEISDEEVAALPDI